MREPEPDVDGEVRASLPAIHAPIPGGIHAPIPGGIHGPIPGDIHGPIPGAFRGPLRQGQVGAHEEPLAHPVHEDHDQRQGESHALEEVEVDAPLHLDPNRAIFTSQNWSLRRVRNPFLKCYDDREECFIYFKM